jgi:hypothetical protein
VSGLVRPEVKGFYAQLERPGAGGGGRVPNLQDIHPLRGIRMAR